VNPVSAEGAGDDNDAANREEHDETNALSPGKRKREERWDWQRVYHEIGDNVQRRLYDQWRSFRDAVAMIGLQFPVAGDRSVRVSIETFTQCSDTHMHCTHKATRNTMNAANTIAKVPQTSLRKSDFSGAIRRYDRRMETFTVDDARTNNVWPASEAWLFVSSAYSNTSCTEADLLFVPATMSKAIHPKHAGPNRIFAMQGGPRYTCRC
jgi:hypothetical protein